MVTAKQRMASDGAGARVGTAVKRALAVIALGALAIDEPAMGADLPLEARPQPAYDWSGFYLGAHFGYGDARLGADANPLSSQGVFLPPSPTGLIGGYQGGYNRQFGNHLVLGVELDATFTSPADTARLVTRPYQTTFDYFATARGRVGYAMGTWLPYATAGVAFGRTKLNLFDGDGELTSSTGRDHVGWTAGGGVEVAVGGNWSAKAEYAYLDLM